MPQKTVKVCSYNVQMKDQYPGQALANTTRAKLIAGLLAKSDYDVLVFSEAFDDDARDVMVKILAKQGNYKYRTAIVGGGREFNPVKITGAPGLVVLGAEVGGVLGGVIGGFGLSLGALAGGAILVGGFLLLADDLGLKVSDGGIFIVSRWPIEMQSQIVYRDGIAPDRYAKKGVSWALINKEDFRFHVFGTHMQAGDRLPSGSRPWGDGSSPVVIRQKQFTAFRAMADGVLMYWLPALMGGDLNVDYCFDKDRCAGNEEGLNFCCSDRERKSMLGVLRASMPGDVSKFVYTSDSANDMKGGDGKATTLDYVLSSDTHLAPVRSSLETVKLQAPWTEVVMVARQRKNIHHKDLSDHYAVVGTYTFPHRREDTPRFVGVWRCVTFNGRPDTHKHGLTFYPFGTSVVEVFDGKVSGARIQNMNPGGPAGGEITLKRLPSNEVTKYEYAFKNNPDFIKPYFIGGDILAHKKPPLENMLTLRNQQRTAVYAFEEWLPLTYETPGGGGRGPAGGGDGPSSGGGERGGGPTPGTDRPIRER